MGADNSKKIFGFLSMARRLTVCLGALSEPPFAITGKDETQ